MPNKKITNVEIVKAFNKLKAKPYLTVKALQQSKPYRVLSMFRHKAKFGNVVMAELENGMLYLPRRYNKLDDKVLGGADNAKLMLRKNLNNDEYVLELEEMPSEVEINKDENNDGNIYIPNTQPIF